MDDITMQTPLDGEVSIPFEQIPVLLYRNKEEAQEVAARAVNFLRCGCRAVQVIINRPIVMVPDYINEMRECLSDAVEVLSILPCTDDPLIMMWSHIYKVRSLNNSSQFGNLNFVFLVFETSKPKKSD